MCTNFLTVTHRFHVTLGGRVFSKSWSTFTRVRSNSVVTDIVWMACIRRLALIDICKNHKERKEKCFSFFRMFNERNSLHWNLIVQFQNRGLLKVYLLWTSPPSHIWLISRFRELIIIMWLVDLNYTLNVIDFLKRPITNCAITTWQVN